MDAFEQLVSEILWLDGYWVRTSVKVNLTKEDKIAINKPSAPRWELDIVAYQGKDNTLRIIECKSYLDSKGVQAADVLDRESANAGRYNLFHDEPLRKVIFRRISEQFSELGACAENPKISLGLACAKISRESERPILKSFFYERGWELLDDIWLRERLKKMSTGSYENQVSAVVAKLLLRGDKPDKPGQSLSGKVTET